MTQKSFRARGPVVAGAIIAVSLLGAGAANAAGQCVRKAAEGTGSSEEAAKFQVFEALLQATDWSAWAAWMSNGTTPGYKVNPPQYKCVKGGGLGVTCRGQTTICKL
ncbi:MAG: hypothetical protein ACRCS9_16015 [Hyphomicrobium sp.]